MARQDPVDVKNTGEVGAFTWSGHSAETVGRNRMVLVTGTALEEAIEVRRKDGSGVAAVGQTRECPVQRCRGRGRKVALNGLAHTTRFCWFRPFETTLEQAERNIRVATVIALNFGALGWLEVAWKQGLVVQVVAYASVQVRVQPPREFLEVGQMRRSTHGDARSGQEEHFLPRVGEKKIFGEFCRVVGDLDQAGICRHGAGRGFGLSRTARVAASGGGGLRVNRTTLPKYGRMTTIAACATKRRPAQ